MAALGMFVLLYVATGIWLKGLIPVAFFACARRLLGTWPALAATCASRH